MQQNIQENKSDSLLDFIDAYKKIPNTKVLLERENKEGKKQELVFELRAPSIVEYDKYNLDLSYNPIEAKRLLLTTCSVSPDFHDARLQDKFGSTKPEEILANMLTRTEYDLLWVAFHGKYLTDPQEIIEKAKDVIKKK